MMGFFPTLTPEGD